MYTVSRVFSAEAHDRASPTCMIFPRRSFLSSKLTKPLTSRRSHTCLCLRVTRTCMKDVSEDAWWPADVPDDPAVYHGMPIGLQIIGRRGEDEAVIRMTEIVEQAVKKAGQK